MTKQTFTLEEMTKKGFNLLTDKHQGILQYRIFENDSRFAITQELPNQTPARYQILIYYKKGKGGYIRDEDGRLKESR